MTSEPADKFDVADRRYPDLMLRLRKAVSFELAEEVSDLIVALAGEALAQRPDMRAAEKRAQAVRDGLAPDWRGWRRAWAINADARRQAIASSDGTP